MWGEKTDELQKTWEMHRKLSMTCRRSGVENNRRCPELGWRFRVRKVLSKPGRLYQKLCTLFSPDCFSSWIADPALRLPSKLIVTQRVKEDVKVGVILFYLQTVPAITIFPFGNNDKKTPQTPQNFADLFYQKFNPVSACSSR